MYSITPDPPKITKEFILNHISEEDIFTRYIGSGISFTHLFKLPYVDESTPSAKFFVGDDGKLRFKDFGRGQSLDCFGLVMFMNRCDFPTALRTIAHDFNLQYFDVSATLPIDWKASSNPARVKTETIIEVKRKVYTIEEIAWWKEFFITLAILKHFQVNSLSNFWVNGRMKTADGNHLFGYDLGVDEKGIKRWKIYRPLQPKIEKWSSNTRAVDIQGWNQLPKTGELVIITSSLKDVMALRALGYYAIAFQSEVGLFDEKIIAELKTRFKRILLFLDGDETGITWAKNNSDKYGIPFIYIPVKAYKDPTDALKGMKHEGIKLIKQLIQ